MIYRPPWGGRSRRRDYCRGTGCRVGDDPKTGPRGEKKGDRRRERRTGIGVHGRKGIASVSRHIAGERVERNHRGTSFEDCTPVQGPIVL